MKIAFLPFVGFDPITHCAVPGFDFRAATDGEELAELARESDALVLVGPRYTRSLARRLAEPGSRLRLIQFLSAGYESAEFFGVPPGVALCNGSTIWGPVVAEHALALLLGLLRRLPQLERRRAGRVWGRDELVPELGSLDGMRIGILGYGTIGREIARRLSPFGAEVVGIARQAKTCPHAARVVAFAELNDLLPTLGALINVVPAGPATEKLVDGAMLSRLRREALLVNVGRGATMDEAALVEALRGGAIAGAGLDVFETEPLSADSPLWGLENVILSPHCAGYGSQTAMRRAHELCRDNLVSLRDGTPLRSQVHL